MGVTSLDPNNLEFPASATQLCDESWVLSGSTVLHNGEAIVDEYNCDLDLCNIGDRVGVQRTTNGELHIFMNGEDRGVAATEIPSKVYAVIDLYGKCTEVTIVNADRSKSMIRSVLIIKIIIQQFLYSTQHLSPFKQTSNTVTVNL